VQSVIDEDEVEAVKKMMAPVKKRKREKKVVDESTTVPKTPRAKKASKVALDLAPVIVEPSPVVLPPDLDIDSDDDSDSSVILLTKTT